MDELELKILKSLLESPKTFNQLLNAGFQISRPTLTIKLDELKKTKFITKKKRKSPYEINLQYFEEKNDTVLSLLITKHGWFFYPEYPPINHDVVNSLSLDYNYVIQENTKDAIRIQKSKIEDFREKLMLSEAFFKIFLENDSNDMYGIFQDILSTDTGMFSLNRKYFDESIICDAIFKNCVKSDIISGHKSKEAIEYVKKINEMEVYLNKFLNPSSADTISGSGLYPIQKLE